LHAFHVVGEEMEAVTCTTGNLPEHDDTGVPPVGAVGALDELLPPPQLLRSAATTIVTPHPSTATLLNIVLIISPFF
jgi:hypothetical protein